MEEFYRIRRLPPYVFEQVNRAKAAARNAGADIIDMGMGNPDLPTNKFIVDKLIESVQRPDTHGYSTSKGIPGLRRAQAGYYERRFGVKLDGAHVVVIGRGVTVGRPIGLMLTRAWLLREIGKPEGTQVLIDAAAPHLTGDNFMATHWLITYAVLAEDAEFLRMRALLDPDCGKEG